MCAWVLLTVLAAGPADFPATEELLWQQVQSCQSLPSATENYATWCSAAIARRQVLLAAVRRYLTLYPGGQHRLRAVELELSALYDLASLGAGDFSALSARVDWYLRHTPSTDPVHCEAAWWDILCSRFNDPAQTPHAADRPDRRMLTAWAEYLTRYPRSRHVPRLAAELFDDAEARGDCERLRQIVELLANEFPDDPITRRLKGRLGRIEAIGRPFWLAGDLPDGGQIDTRSYLGQPVLIVAWDPQEERARQLVAQVRDYCRSRRQFKCVGVSLAASRRELMQACAGLELDWPQFDDNLGPANGFARQWGIDACFCVFVVDPEGRLVGSAEDETWRELADRTLRD